MSQTAGTRLEAKTGGERVFAFTQVQGISFAVDAASIAQVLGARGDNDALDLVDYFEMSKDGEEPIRKTLVLHNGEHPLVLRIGPQLVVETVSARDCYPLPGFVAAGPENAGVAAVIARAGVVSFVLSPASIAAASERPPRQRLKST